MKSRSPSKDSTSAQAHKQDVCALRGSEVHDELVPIQVQEETSIKAFKFVRSAREILLRLVTEGLAIDPRLLAEDHTVRQTGSEDEKRNACR